jgi:cation diffusion facilitator CzcD-associated flavoprotein CzcO
VIVKDLPRDELKTFYFDHVLVCTGISTPLFPKIEGHKSFKGQVMHSRDYRNTKMFESERVLVIGTGPSAIDIVLQVGKVAEKVFWVHRMNEKYEIHLNIDLSESVAEKSGMAVLILRNFKFKYNN